MSKILYGVVLAHYFSMGIVELRGDKLAFAFFFGRVFDDLLVNGTAFMFNACFWVLDGNFWWFWLEVGRF